MGWRTTAADPGIPVGAPGHKDIQPHDILPAEPCHGRGGKVGESVLRLVGVALTVALALSGCGISTSSDQASTSSGVPLPRSRQEEQKEQHAFNLYYRELLGEGVSAKVARCYRGEIDQLPPGEIESIAHPRTPAMWHKAIVLNKKLSESCLPPGTELYAPKVSAAQLERTRKQLEEALPLALENQGASSAQIKCVVTQIHGFSPAVIKEFTTDKPAAKQIMNAIYAKCRGAK